MIKRIVPSKYEIAVETKERLAIARLGFPIEELSPLDILKVVEIYSKAKKFLKGKNQKPRLRKNGNHNFHQRRCIKNK